MTAALQTLRPHIHLAADAQVRVLFVGEVRIPAFECDPCEELLQWNSECGWWECPRCSYELTPPEAEELLELAIKRLGAVREDVSRRIPRRWSVRLGRWFARLLRH